MGTRGPRSLKTVDMFGGRLLQVSLRSSEKGLDVHLKRPIREGTRRCDIPSRGEAMTSPGQQQVLGCSERWCRLEGPRKLSACSDWDVTMVAAVLSVRKSQRSSDTAKKQQEKVNESISGALPHMMLYEHLQP